MRSPTAVAFEFTTVKGTTTISALERNVDPFCGGNEAASAQAKKTVFLIVRNNVRCDYLTSLARCDVIHAECVVPVCCC